MRIYLQPPQPSRGLQRIADALVRYAPLDAEVVTDEAQADLVIIYAIGRCNAVTMKAKAIRASGRKYAVVQVCLRSTLNPHVLDWLPLWENCQAVWSYYDLNQACVDDGVVPSFEATIRFYHAPLGANAETFQVHPNWTGERKYVVLSSGLSRLSESVRECHLAAKEVGRPSAHLGPLDMEGVDAYQGLPDSVLRGLYNVCEFVSGLRRKEGFELPAIEGLLCGARPIVFNTPDYHWCYGNHAIYIEETDRQGVIDQLVQLFKHGAPPVSEEERQRAVERYDWKTIVGGFYERLM